MDLEAMFKNATKETIVHVRYSAGRQATHRAVEEALMAADWEKPSDEYVGHFESLRRTKKGDLVLTLFVHNRGEAGRYRAFNPTLGTLKEVVIVQA